MTGSVTASQAMEALRHLRMKALAKIVAEGHFPLGPRHKDCVDDANTIATYISQQEERILQLSTALFRIRQCTDVVTKP